MINLSNNNVNFTSRSSVIRQADQICRTVNNNFTSISPSKVLNKGLLRKDPNIIKFGEKLQEKLNLSIRNLSQKFNSRKEPDFFDDFTNAIKTKKIANCGELARLASLVCAVNGIKSQVVNLIQLDGKESYERHIDHAVLAIRLSNKKIACGTLSKLKDTLIIDPWLGFVDYAKNAQTIYKNIYYKQIGIPEKSLIGIDTITGARDRIPTEYFEKLKQNFPELIIK